MQKILTYDLGAKDGTLPDIPWLHDYKLSDIQIESGKIKLTSKDFGSHDYDYSDITGFHPKKVTVEFLCGDTGEPAECNVYIVRFRPKKQFRENNKFGYGARVNCYDITEFVTFYKDYDMQFIETAVGANKAIVKFGLQARQEIVMEFLCEKVNYIFSDII